MVLGFNLNSTTAALLATSVATDLIALLQLLVALVRHTHLTAPALDGRGLVVMLI